MKFHPILVDDSLQELTKLGTDDFPISVNLLRVQDEGCYRVQHWHEEIQILLMIQGNAVFETPSGRYDLKEGTGLFINSGILHGAPVILFPAFDERCRVRRANIETGTDMNLRIDL